MEQWTDPQGKTFKGEPAQVLGPLALFRLPGNNNKIIPFGQLSSEDCARFAAQLRTIAQPAADWGQTKTDIGSDILGNAMRVEGSELKPVDLKGRPEPQFYALVFVNNGEGKSWGVLGRVGWQLQEMQKRYPGMVEGLMFGLKHNGNDQRNMAVQMKVPFLVASFGDEYNMRSIQALAPNWGYGFVMCNANGVPVFISQADTDDAGKVLFAEIGKLLEVIRPDNPKGWNDSEHYWKAAQPVLHATDKCEPKLVGDPLNPAKLREFGVESFEASIDVSAEGVVTGVTIAPGAACPQELLDPVSQALRQARLVPAVDRGKFVAGTYQYRFGAKN
jgi:hypothetical protein